MIRIRRKETYIERKKKKKRIEASEGYNKSIFIIKSVKSQIQRRISEELMLQLFFLLLHDTRIAPRFRFFNF